jgi:hypothetical protein
LLALGDAPIARPRASSGRLVRRREARHRFEYRSTQPRVDDFDFAEGEIRRLTVTTPVPGSIVQTIGSPTSKPRMAATAAGTVVRIDSIADKLRVDPPAVD